MIRIILTYGVIAGLVIILSAMAVILFLSGMPHASNPLLGYLVQLVALSSILVAVRQYRNDVLGGVISFGTALKLGLGIALVAAAIYVIVWEIYLASTGYVFMDQMIASTLAAKRAAGVGGAEYARLAAEMEGMRTLYANPLMRVGITFIEIFPMGLVISLVSAWLLKNPNFLPAKARPAAA